MEPGVHVEFEMFPMLNGIKSKEAGREIYDEKPHVRIRVAGNDKEEFFGPVNEQIRQRFPEEFASWQKGNEVPLTGTPVERWPQITQAQVKNLKALNIRTVEDLATLPDFGLQKLGMGAQKLRSDAQRFLSLAQQAAEVAQVDELKDTITRQNEQMAKMQEQIAALMAAQAPKAEPAPGAVEPQAEEQKRRGRPPKVQA